MVRSGLQVLLGEGCRRLRGRRVALISHAAAVLPDFTRSADALHAALGDDLVALCGMEHGFAGSGADAMPVGHGRDARTGLPVYSLFEETREPPAELLAQIDALIFDAQDVGARFYTFITTLRNVLRAAGRAGLPVFVLDRPNPIGGEQVEGPLPEPAWLSWYAAGRIPIRHGMTAGELARFFNDEQGLGADVTVIRMDGWRRATWFDLTGLPWVGPSPAMPHLSTATVYPGACLLEGLNVSAGRGTGLPFEQFGAAWVDEDALCDLLNAEGLPGVRFRPTSFEPALRYDPRWEGATSALCRGAQIHVTDRDALRPVAMGLQVVAAFRRLHPECCAWQPHFDTLTGSPRPRERLDAGAPPRDVCEGWAADEAAFIERRRPYLLYV